MISETCGALMIALGLVGLVASCAAISYFEQPVLRRARRLRMARNHKRGRD
jgi:hypothetical protein